MKASLYLIYDGSFDGLLSAIHYGLNSVKEDIFPVFVAKGTETTIDMFAEYKEIETSDEYVDKLSNIISKKISNIALKDIYYAFLSDVTGVENIIYDYIKLGLKKGKKIEEMHSKESVQEFRSIVKKVSRERHRMLGFLRFKKLDFGVYYAPMEPEHNIITLIAPHFEKRLSDQSFIIHDVKRDIYAMYNQDELIYTSEELSNSKITEDEEEQNFKSLWQEYFTHVTINERKNLKLQQQFLPKKYWKHLTEKDNSLNKDYS